MLGKIFNKFDYILLLCVLFLVGTGITFIYSSGVNSDGVLKTNEYIKQIIWAAIGLVSLIVLSFLDYRKSERYASWLYLGLLVVLIYTRIFGRLVNGARSWIGIGEAGIQPSEFGKIIYILMLAKYLANSQNEKPFKRFVIATLIFFGPFALIMIQPDFGTSIVYIPIFFLMCYFAGIKPIYLAYLFLTGTIAVFFTILPVWNNFILSKPIPALSVLSSSFLKIILIVATASIALIGIIVRKYFHGPKYFFWITYVFSIMASGLILSTVLVKVMKEYQIQRLIVFMNPEIDPLGTGWNIIQSKIAIGSGGVFGQSFLQGTQSHYQFLPEQSTDFIFSIFSEEAGFVGGLFVFLLYCVIMSRLLYIIRKTSNRYGQLITAGVLGMFMMHFFINTGMVMGIMPITGIPLLFMSYGGSSLLMAMSCIGIVMSVNSRKFAFS